MSSRNQDKTLTDQCNHCNHCDGADSSGPVEPSTLRNGEFPAGLILKENKPKTHMFEYRVMMLQRIPAASRWKMDGLTMPILSYFISNVIIMGAYFCPQLHYRHAALSLYTAQDETEARLRGEIKQNITHYNTCNEGPTCG